MPIPAQPAPAPLLPSLGRRQTLLVGTLMLLLLAVLGLVVQRTLQQRAEEAAASQTQRIAQRAARALSEGLDERLREVRALAESDSLWRAGLHGPDVNATLVRQQRIHPHHAWIGVTDTRGIVQLATGSLLIGKDVSQRPWFQAGLIRPHVGDVHPAKLLAEMLPPMADGEPVRFLDFAAPILSEGRLLGVIGIHGSWDWTRQVVESQLPPPAERASLEIFVFDARGSLIYARDGLGRAPADARLPLDAVRQLLRDGARRQTWPGAEGPHLSAAAGLVTHDTASDLGWFVVVRQAAGQGQAQALRDTATLLGIGLVLALLATLLARWRARRLGQQLSSLALALHRMSRPGPLPPLPPCRHEHRETGELVQAVEHLATELRQRHASALAAAASASDPSGGPLHPAALQPRLDQTLRLGRSLGLPTGLVLLSPDPVQPGTLSDADADADADRLSALRELAGRLSPELGPADLLALVDEGLLLALPGRDSEDTRHHASALVRKLNPPPVDPATTPAAPTPALRWASTATDRAGFDPGPLLTQVRQALLDPKRPSAGGPPAQDTDPDAPRAPA